MSSTRGEIREAPNADRDEIHRIRHHTYATELGQQPENESGELRDALDELNTYLVAGPPGRSPRLRQHHASVEARALHRQVLRSQRGAAGAAIRSMIFRKSTLVLTLVTLASQPSLAGEIHVAAEKGDVAAVTLLLEEGVHPDTLDERKDFKGGSPLLHAAYNGHADVCSVLLEHGADVNLTDPRFRRSALHLAALKGHADVVDVLLAGGADLDPRDHESVTPLALAMVVDDSRHRSDVVGRLLAAGADPHVSLPPNDYTPLHGAAYYGRTDSALLLIEHDADIDAESKNGNTPLILAVGRNNSVLARYLIEAGARVDVAESSSGMTPLHTACVVGDAEVARLLIDAGADVGHSDNSGRQPLHWAAQNGYAEIADVLLDNGATVDAPGLRGLTPLHASSALAHPEVVALLIEAGAPVDAVDDEGRTALHWAAAKGGKLTKEPFDWGASPFVWPFLSPGRRRPVPNVSPEDYLEIVRLLIQNGADVNARTGKGRTPLTEARQRKHKAAIELLLAHGATK